MPDAAALALFTTGQGFVAALDQSGGSTPQALQRYGIDPSQYRNEAEMFDLIHTARTRVLTSPAFTSDRLIGAILFAGSLDREVDGCSVPEFLRAGKGLLPFLKIDVGLDLEHDGVQPMREIPDLDALLARAAAQGISGTKERSVIHAADLLPILEPEIDIDAPDKAEAEALLKAELLRQLDTMEAPGSVAVKITIPTIDGFYSDLVAHPRVARVLALSGGYPRDEANRRLARNTGVIASFSRALLDGLSVSQSDEDFDRTLDASIESIYRASIS